MTDTQTLLVGIILAGGIIYTTGMYLYRKITAGESFSVEKYALTFGYVALAAVAAYLASGIIPDFGTILAQVESTDPTNASTVLSVATAVIIGIIKKFSGVSIATQTTSAGCKCAASTVTTATPVPASTAKTTEVVAEATPAWVPGLTVTPAFQKGNSPLPVTLTVKTGMESATGKRCKVRVDWMDGNPLEQFVADEVTGVAIISHTYVYAQGDSKYTGHSFYPEIQAMTSDGTTVIETINVDGKCCEIEVQSVKAA